MPDVRISRLSLILLTLTSWGTLPAQVSFGPNQGAAYLRTEPSSAPGQTLTLALRAGPQRLAAIGVSGFGVATPTPWGTLWLGPDLVLPWALVTDSQGDGQFALRVPALPGIEAYLQAVVLQSSPPLVLSNLARVRIGGAPLVWYDDFESYPGGLYPSGWRMAVGNTDQLVDGTVAGQGVQSLKVVGLAGSCWAAGSGRPIDPFHGLYPNDFTVDLLVRNGDVAQFGCHAWFRAMLSFGRRDQGGRNLFITRPDGTVSFPGLTGGPQIPLLQWHRVCVRYTRMSATEVRLICSVDGTRVGTSTLATDPNEDAFNELFLTSAEGPVWFDDVRIWAGFGQ